ncbi:MAG: hypothetical protein IJ530_12565 [Treponema sp.]|uniref:hypothetical protein n=1 Tax=Treponema sp. TaxID=166 RepID=UPI0025ECD8BE|nr:hypothetical protein [Treponema sp.]MBQ8680574.1 hypothetical protein [Treponema sp.]
MKSTIKTGIYIAIATSLAFSCASNPKTSNNSVANDSNSMSTELPSAADLYSDKANSSKITVLSSPKETTKLKNFSSPYVIKVEDSLGNAVTDFEVTVVYPSSRKDGKIIYGESTIVTNSEGKAEFTPPAPECSFNSEIRFFPKGDISDLKIKETAKANTVSAAYKVQTNLKSAGGIIALVDFNQNGKAITSNPVSSSNLLMTLMKLGFTRIGNIDLTNQVIVGDDAKIRAKAKEIVGSTSNFLVYGTVKIDSTAKTADGTAYTLNGNIKCMDLKSGEITFAATKVITVSDKNDWNALDKARKTLASDFANEIKYGI